MCTQTDAANAKPFATIETHQKVISPSKAIDVHAYRLVAQFE